MTYNLFVDDVRDPSDVQMCRGRDWVVARSIEDVVTLLQTRGRPAFVSYDHDMTAAHYGGDYSDRRTGEEIAYVVTTHCGRVPFQVHSWNPDAGARIVAGIEMAEAAERNLVALDDGYRRERLP